MGIFILLFTILTIVFLIAFIKLVNDDSSNKIKIIIGIIIFIMFISCTTGILNTVIYNTNSVTEIINDYKSNKIKEIIIIENQDTTYKYKY
jgi:hypothetical protein